MTSLGEPTKSNGFEIRGHGRAWLTAFLFGKSRPPGQSQFAPGTNGGTRLRGRGDEQTSAAEGVASHRRGVETVAHLCLADRVEALSALFQVWSPTGPAARDREVLALMVGGRPIQSVAGRFVVAAASGRGMCRTSSVPGPTVNRRRLQTSPGRLVVSTPVCRV